MFGSSFHNQDCSNLLGPYDFESKRPFKGANFDPNERRRPSIMVKPSDSRNGGRITVEDNYPLPPIGKNSMMASIDDEMVTIL